MTYDLFIAPASGTATELKEQNLRLRWMINDLRLQLAAAATIIAGGVTFHDWRPVNLRADLEGESETYWQCDKCHAVDEGNDKPDIANCRGGGAELWL